MKTCTGCKTSLPLEAFAKKRQGLQARCRVCHSKYTRAHYATNKQYYKDKAKRNNAKYDAVLRSYVWDYLLAHPCACGEIDPIVLEFDHNDPVIKSFNVATILVNRKSLDVLKTEIAKCTVRCANCHKRKTNEQFGLWKLTFGDQTVTL